MNIGLPSLSSEKDDMFRNRPLDKLKPNLKLAVSKQSWMEEYPIQCLYFKTIAIISVK